MQIVPIDTVPLSIFDRIKRVGAGLFLLAGGLFLLWDVSNVIDPAWVASGSKFRYFEAVPPLARGAIFVAMGLFVIVLSVGTFWSAVRSFKAPKWRYRTPLDNSRRRT